MVSGDQPKWKPAIWKLSHGGGQVKRILRVNEIRELIKNVSAEDQGLYKTTDVSSKNARLWFQAMLFSAMRLSELIRLKDNPTYDGKELLDYDRGTIFLPKQIFGDAGKGFIYNKERIVFLSSVGRTVMKRFMEEASIPRLISGNPGTKRLRMVFDSMLQASAARIGLSARTFSMTKRQFIMDAYGHKSLDERGRPMFKKIQIPMSSPTTGVMVRSFRSTYESWLVATLIRDPVQMLNIVGSMGHKRETAEEYYIVSGQFDAEDLEDIKKNVEGWGVIPMQNAVIPENPEQ